MSLVRAVWRFFRDHKAIDIILLVVIVLLAAQGWLNSGLPKGHDALFSTAIAADVKGFICEYHSVPEWSKHYLGYPPYLWPSYRSLQITWPSVTSGT